MSNNICISILFIIMELTIDSNINIQVQIALRVTFLVASKIFKEKYFSFVTLIFIELFNVLLYYNNAIRNILKNRIICFTRVSHDNYSFYLLDKYISKYYIGYFFSTTFLRGYTSSLSDITYSCINMTIVVIIWFSITKTTLY